VTLARSYTILRTVLRTALGVGGLLLAGLIALWLCPGLVLLSQRDLRSRSPYCSVWRGVLDAKVKVREAQAAAEISRGSRRLRREGALDLWQTPFGPYWVPPGNDEILSILLAQQQRRIYGKDNEDGVHRGDIVLDCGAHVGVFTKTALAAGASLVVAIEPSPDTVEALRRNLAAEVKAGRVIIYPKGVWDREDILTLFDNGNSAAGNSFVNRESQGSEIPRIPVTTIDRLVNELQLPKVDFIKTDIKGASERALTGAAGVLVRFHPRLAISTEEPPEDAQAITNLLLRLGKDYHPRGGCCLFDGHEIYTDVVFFH
jgi:FkbM family methyltransferase